MSGFNSTLSRSLGPNAFGVASREMDDLFDRLFHSGPANGSKTWAPPISVWEQGESYHLEMDLPGFAEDDIEVTFEDQRLKVSAKRPQPDGEERKYLHNERWWGEVSRSVPLPDSVDPDSIEAWYADGVLHLSMSKRPEVLPKRIEIATK